jgi:hypothetical protein
MIHSSRTVTEVEPQLTLRPPHNRTLQATYLFRISRFNCSRDSRLGVTILNSHMLRSTPHAAALRLIIAPSKQLIYSASLDSTVRDSRLGVTILDSHPFDASRSRAPPYNCTLQATYLFRIF